jgi:hypothetical protein
VIVKIIWQCDECACRAETRGNILSENGTQLPRGWTDNFGEFCKTCAPVVRDRRAVAATASIDRACREMDILTGAASL